MSTFDFTFTSEDARRVTLDYLRAENEQFRKELPEGIAAEHSTGDDLLDDNLSLSDAWDIEMARRAKETN